MANTETKITLAFVAVWLLAILVKLGFIGAIIYIAVHFVAKYW